MALVKAHTSPKESLKLTYLRKTQVVFGLIQQIFTKNCVLSLSKQYLNLRNIEIIERIPQTVP